MKGEQLFNTFADIDEKFIERAEAENPKNAKRFSFLKSKAAIITECAAVLLLVVGLCFAFGNLKRTPFVINAYALTEDGEPVKTELDYSNYIPISRFDIDGEISMFVFSYKNEDKNASPIINPVLVNVLEAPAGELPLNNTENGYVYVCFLCRNDDIPNLVNYISEKSKDGKTYNVEIELIQNDGLYYAKLVAQNEINARQDISEEYSKPSDGVQREFAEEMKIAAFKFIFRGEEYDESNENHVERVSYFEKNYYANDLVNGYTFCCIPNEYVDCVIVESRFGNYIFKRNYVGSPSELMLYLYKDGEFITIENAIKSGIVTPKQIFDIVSKDSNYGVEAEEILEVSEPTSEPSENSDSSSESPEISSNKYIEEQYINPKELYVLSKDKPVLTPTDEEGVYTVFGVKCVNIVDIEIVDGEIQYPGRYFFRVNLYESSYNGQAVSEIKNAPAVINAWMQKGETNEDGKKYIADMVLIYYTGDVPILTDPDENGCFEIFGVKCLGVKYDLFVQNGKPRDDYHRLTIYLPEDSNENEVIEKLLENENVTSAYLNEYMGLEEELH